MTSKLEGLSRAMAKKATKKWTDTAGFNEELCWYLTSSASALGERSNLNALVAAASRGITGGPSGVPSTDLYSDMQVGWNLPDGVTIGLVERERRCREAWNRLSPEHKETLAARYCQDSNKYPPGFISNLGDIGVLTWLEAARAGKLEEVNGNEEKHKAKWKEWRDAAIKASIAAHEGWRVARGDVAVEAA